jgi:hypothetical protein
VKHFVTMFLLCIVVLFTAQLVRLARWPFRLAFTAVCVLGYFFLPGCAVLPIPFQPANEQYNSNASEGAWLVLDGVDTTQTMHLKEIRNPTSRVTCNHEGDSIAAKLYGGVYPSPSRVLLTNLALAAVHTMATSWLDDEVAKHDQLNDGSVGGWYVGRIAWHAASIAYSAASVLNNVKQGCDL